MSLLGSIAAALSEGVGGGMVQNAKWGEEKAAQAKKEAADDARLQVQMKNNDADRKSREGIFAGQLEEMKNERLSRAEQDVADRENAWRIANIRASSSGGGGESSSLRELKFIDSQITDFDTTIKDLTTAYAAEMDPEKQKAIAGQIDAWRAKRQAFVTSDIVQQTIASNGKLGQLYGAALYGGASTADPAQAQEGNIPVSLVVPPPRAVVKPSEGGLLNKMSAKQNSYIGSKPNYPSSSDFTNPQVNDSDVTSKYLYRQGGITADDARTAISKLGYHLPDAY